MLYRELYVNQRSANINDKFNPNQPELFLDESYCHIDRSTGRTWVRSRGVVNESGRKPILVILAAFILSSKRATSEKQKLLCTWIERGL
jgi:hypothetical protein